MSSFKHISAGQARSLLHQGATLIDIRDALSFQQEHIEGAVSIDNSNITAFISSTEKNTPLIVCCYHGFSSQSAAQFLCEQGFTDVYSLDGGFEGWKTSPPGA